MEYFIDILCNVFFFRFSLGIVILEIMDIFRSNVQLCENLIFRLLGH